MCTCVCRESLIQAQISQPVRGFATVVILIPACLRKNVFRLMNKYVFLRPGPKRKKNYWPVPSSSIALWTCTKSLKDKQDHKNTGVRQANPSLDVSPVSPHPQVITFPFWLLFSITMSIDILPIHFQFSPLSPKFKRSPWKLFNLGFNLKQPLEHKTSNGRFG